MSPSPRRQRRALAGAECSPPPPAPAPLLRLPLAAVGSVGRRLRALAVLRPLRPSPCPAPRPPRKSGISPPLAGAPLALSCAPCAPLDTIETSATFCSAKCRYSVILRASTNIRRRPARPAQRRLAGAYLRRHYTASYSLASGGSRASVRIVYL